MKIDDIELIRLLPKFIRSDPSDIGIAKAIDYLVQSAFTDVKTLRVWDQFESLNEKQCDELAWELDVDWYDSARMTLDEKRDTLKTATAVKRKRGTKWSVEQLITSYFGDGFVMEWTDFNGQPYTFMVLTTNDSIDDDTLVRFKKAVDAVKNERSRLVGVLYFWNQENEAAEIVSYDDTYHRYEIKRCGLTPHATTVGILNRETVNTSSSDTDDFYAYRLVPIDDKKSCGTLGGHRGSLGSADKANVEVSQSVDFDRYDFKKSGTAKCDESVGSSDSQETAASYDDHDRLYAIKRIANVIKLTKTKAEIESEEASNVRLFTYKRCGIYRCIAS